jgi:hypothetical protein
MFYIGCNKYIRHFIGLDRPLGLQEFEIARISIQETHERGKAVRSIGRTSLPPGNIPTIHFCKQLSQPHGHCAAERITSINNFN